MTEYSRFYKGTVSSTGGATLVVCPFLPSKVEIYNTTSATTPTTGGIPYALWDSSMGSGAYLAEVFNATPVLTTAYATTGGISPISAGQLLQYGAVQTIGASGSITSTNSTTTTIVTTAAHGLVSGNVVIFSNLYESATTGMPQMAGIPLMVTVTNSTTFTVNWNASGSNYTTITGGSAIPNAAAFRQVLYPWLYSPGVSPISAITTGTTTTITTGLPNNFVVGQEIAFRIPSTWGTVQLNSLPNSSIPGAPIYGYVTSITNSTTFVCSINSTGYTAFTTNQSFNTQGLSYPQVLAVGDVNTGGVQYSGGVLYPSPSVYTGYSTAASSTINGPAISGAYINATFQGFVIGAAIAGAASNNIIWYAYLSDNG